MKRKRINIYLILIIILLSLFELFSVRRRRCEKIRNVEHMNKLMTGYITNKNYGNMLLIERNIDKFRYILLGEKINVVAVYGVGVVGKKLIDLLVKANISICYCIDQNSVNLVEGIDVLEPESIKEDMDMIIVTPEKSFDEIRNILDQKVSVPIVRLSELLEEVLLFI